MRLTKTGQGPMSFGELLTHYRARCGKSRHHVAVEVGVDPSYLTRIEHLERGAPTQPIVEALARVLRLTPEERDRLLVAAGVAPLGLNGRGWEPAYAAVAAVLGDDMLPACDRAEFAALILSIASRWRR